MTPARPRLYVSGRHTDARMHLGGIGTGNFEIGADGQFTTWQLFNTLRDGEVPFYFLAKAGQTVKLLQTAGGPDWPRVSRIEMTGEYPAAVLRFVDADLPVRIELTAFSPFAPLDPEYSGMPVAAFVFRLQNPTGRRQTVSLAALMQNPVGYEAEGGNQSVVNSCFGGNVNEVLREGRARGLMMRAGAGTRGKAPGLGTLALVALQGETTVLPAFEDWGDAWKMFGDRGQFVQLSRAQPNLPTPAGRTINGGVASTLTVRPNETVEIPFILAWHYPNKFNHEGEWMGCHYATQWPDAGAVARQAARDFPELKRRTDLFRTTFYDSTLPCWLLDCVTANAGIIRHIGVVFRIANGDIYGWEGSNGCCDPTCTHVWGYEQSLAHLFPSLEREMRRIDFKHQQNADGGINNRTQVPSPPQPSGEHPFADGHASCILKAYREALNSEDEHFVQDYWPHARRAVDYLIGRDAKSGGGQPRGILQDDQWNTYDEALHGVNPFISGYYLAALRAGEEWARRVGDTATAGRWHAIFESGQKQLIELCWNGEYFQQNQADYLSREGEVGPGCMSDQLIGQWWAHQLGLGYILPPEMVRTALRSIYQYNWKSDLTNWRHAPRAFAGANDKGLIVCTWPKGGRPAKVLLYSDEVWTGLEYEVAALMIYEGLLPEGMAIVKGARDRYDGVPRAPIPRNPWNEIECGGHYARAMSSWSLLPALSGFEIDGPRASVRFCPRHTPENFKCFIIGPEGWGSVAQTVDAGTQKVALAIKWGKMSVQTLTLQAGPGVKTATVAASVARKRRALEFVASDRFVAIDFGEKIHLGAGDRLEVRLA